MRVNPSWAIRVSVGVALFALLLTGGRTGSAGLSTFVVDTTVDTIDIDPGDGVCETESGDCSLRAAIQETNVLPGVQTIELPAGEYVLLRAGCCENESRVGDLDITDDLVLRGAGHEETHMTEQVGLGGVERIFDVREGAIVAMSGFTVRDVFMSAYLPEETEDCGGGIRNYGSLTLSDSAVVNNVFRRRGGGICNFGGLLVQDSLVEGNQAALLGPGGGVFNRASGTARLVRSSVLGNATDTGGGGGIKNEGSLMVVESTISGNVANAFVPRAAGGIDNGNEGIPGSAALVVINSTISDNRSDAPNGAGGITNGGGGVATIINSTITDNENLPPPFSGDPPAAGAGISTEVGSTTNLVNTIVAGNENGDCRAAADSAPPVSLGHNIAGDHTCELSAPGDMENTDPLLGPLADNGGPTMTHALLEGSPAIDTGDAAECPEADQRGAPRPVDGDGGGGAVCDIGAYEAGGVVPTPGPVAGDVDCDGLVTLLDGLEMLRHEAALVDDAPCIDGGNLNCDGFVDSHDALLVFRKLAGLAVPPCELPAPP